MTTTALFRRDVATAVGDAVTPPREARATDVNRISFQMPTVVAIVVAAIAVAGSQYFFQSGIRSDLRDMQTRMELQAEVDKARNEARTSEIKAFNDRVEMLNQSMADLRRLTQMLQIQYQELNSKGKL